MGLYYGANISLTEDNICDQAWLTYSHSQNFGIKILVMADAIVVNVDTG